MLKSLILAIERNNFNKCLNLRYGKSFPWPGAIENCKKKALFKQTRGNSFKSSSYCEWDPVKIWYSDDFFLNAQSL